MRKLIRWFLDQFAPYYAVYMTKEFPESEGWLRFYIVRPAWLDVCRIDDAVRELEHDGWKVVERTTLDLAGFPIAQR